MPQYYVLVLRHRVVLFLNTRAFAKFSEFPLSSSSMFKPTSESIRPCVYILTCTREHFVSFKLLFLQPDDERSVQLWIISTARQTKIQKSS